MSKSMLVCHNQLIMALDNIMHGFENDPFFCSKTHAANRLAANNWSKKMKCQKEYNCVSL
jgi:hypothetical protein